jgi:hypothetical protein
MFKTVYFITNYKALLIALLMETAGNPIRSVNFYQTKRRLASDGRNWRQVLILMVVVEPQILPRGLVFSKMGT